MHAIAPITQLLQKRVVDVVNAYTDTEVKGCSLFQTLIISTIQSKISSQKL